MPDHAGALFAVTGAHYTAASIERPRTGRQRTGDG